MAQICRIGAINVDEYRELKARVEVMEKRLQFLEETFSTLKDFNISSEAGQYIASRQHAISMSKLINAVAGDQRLDMNAQQREVERLTAEKKSADARIKAALKAVDYSVDMDNALINQFSFKQVTGGIEIQSFAGFDSVDEIAIPPMITGKPVVAVGKQAFENVGVKRVHLPDTILNIDEKAFSACKQLVSINLPVSIKSISNNAFYGCPRLNTVELPKRITSMGYSCYRESGISQITIPGSVKEIPFSCFEGCQNLEVAILEEGIEKIGSGAFKNTSIGRIIIPESVRTISEGIFEIDNRSRIKREAIHIAFLGLQTDIEKGAISLLSIFFPREAIVYCKSGSAIQKTARLKNIQVKPLSDFQNLMSR
jgi:hypothetical protein